METVDEEFLEAAVDFIDRQHQDGTPFFVWFNTTHMHFRTHTKPESIGQSGRWQSPYHDTMIDHDKHVGVLLDKLDELGIADNTIVIYSTDNGPHMNSWPDGAMTPFRSEKNTNWEGAFRVPAMVRWPGRIAPGMVSNEIVSHLDWLPTFLAGQEAKSPRPGFFYFSDDGDLTAVRMDNWKQVFMEQRVTGTLQVWAEPFTLLRVPKLFNLRTDPYEWADTTSNTYWDWLLDHAFLAVPTQAIVGEFLATFQEFPPRQKAASFTVDQVMEKLQAGIAS
jgi:arylsulfatase